MLIAIDDFEGFGNDESLVPVMRMLIEGINEPARLVRTAEECESVLQTWLREDKGKFASIDLLKCSFRQTTHGESDLEEMNCRSCL